MKRAQVKAYSLIEIVTVILIVSLVLLFGFREAGERLDRGRARQTIEELKSIHKAITGDEMAVQLGSRVDFGYWGDNADWPDASSIGDFVADVATYLNIGASANIGTDGWGNNYLLTSNGTIFQVLSQGADDAAGGVGLNQDISFTIQKNVWEANSVAIYVHDARGTLLLPAQNTGDLTRGHFWQIVLTENGGTSYTWDSATSTITLVQNAGYVTNSVKAGACTVQVAIADGAGGAPFQGDYNWQPELSNSQPTITQNFIIYPKGGFGRFNVLFVKAPGVALRGFNEVP